MLYRLSCNHLLPRELQAGNQSQSLVDPLCVISEA